MTTNIVQAVSFASSRSLPFVCFDHLSVWLNATNIVNRNHSRNFLRFSGSQLLYAISTACISWQQPMLFNCVIQKEFLNSLYSKYNSYAEGASPDINFLARTADIGIEEYWCYDAPCIITNARHASRSNGSSALKNGTISTTEHTALSGVEVYPRYMENFVTANIIGSLSRYWPESRLREFLDPIKFLQSPLLEYSYPKSFEAYKEMTKSLELYIRFLPRQNF